MNMQLKQRFFNPKSWEVWNEAKIQQDLLCKELAAKKKSQFF